MDSDYNGLGNSDYQEKTERHHRLMKDICEALVQVDDFMGFAVPSVAKMLAQHLHAECVCIFFRNKVDQALSRKALYINDQGQLENKQTDQRYKFDEKYPLGMGTLLYQTFESARTINRVEGNLLEGNIHADPEVVGKIVAQFKEVLPSHSFAHLIISGIYIGHRHLGAIRVINHLDPRAGLKVSDRPFMPATDQALVSSVAVMLAFGYATYRRAQKLSVLSEYTSHIRDAGSYDAAINIFLEHLTSDSIAFPAAFWRKYDENGHSIVTHKRPTSLVLDPEGLPLSLAEGVPATRTATVKAISPDEFRYYDWAMKLRFKAAYIKEISLAEGKRYALVVFAYSLVDLDKLSESLISIAAEVLEGTLRELEPASKIVGNHCKVRNLIQAALRHAQHDRSLMILGESGSGKGEVARLIHRHSVHRSMHPFLQINCGGLSENLAGAGLFGTRKGAFTDAKTDRPGWVDAAKGGTLFFDEVDKMPMGVQSQLLVFLDSMEYAPIGEAAEKFKADVRLIFATNRDLQALVESGEFLSDLFYRIKGRPITVPPLRDRRPDIPVLIEYFLALYNKVMPPALRVRRIDEEAKNAMYNYDWPGNVRELQEDLEDSAIKAKGGVITLDDLPIAIQACGNQPLPLEELKKQCYRNAFSFCASVVEVAERLGKARGTVIDRAKKWGLKTATKPGPQEERERIEKLDDEIADHLVKTMKYSQGEIATAAKVLEITETQLRGLLKKYGIK